jgi:hypothetical protein
MVLLFCPFFLGMKHLYIWSLPEIVSGDEILQHKSVYLNTSFFFIRSAVYLGVWITLSHFLNRWSLERDETGDPSLTDRLQNLSGPGLVLYGTTATFASVDWVMSLEPHWYSTIYGLLFVVGQALTALAFVVPVMKWLADYEPLSEVVSAKHFHDLGNLILTFVMLWAYMAFSQYLIIWSGNLAEEIPWYLRRMEGGWQWIAVFLILFHFALPFLLLLSRAAKRTGRILSRLAIGLLLVRFLDLFWMIMPSFPQTDFFPHWMDIATPIGLGGLWMTVFVRQLKRKSLLSTYETRLEKTVNHMQRA